MTTATYVYCVVKREQVPPLARVPPGMPGGARPRAVRLPAGPRGIWLVVSDVPLDAYGAETINAGLKDMEWVSTRAMAHETVVEFCSRGGDVIPMKLFTLFKDDERAIENVNQAGSLAAIFRRIGRAAEWSVRVTCAPAASAEAKPAPGGRRGARSPATRSGTSFLLRKKTDRDEARKAAAEARRAVEEVHRCLSRVAKASIRKEGDVPGTSLMLDAAFLVPRRKEKAFHREVTRLAAKAGRAGCEMVLSGPWPAYHFVAEA
jgi:hypothetical protein